MVAFVVMNRLEKSGNRSAHFGSDDGAHPKGAAGAILDFYYAQSRGSPVSLS